MKRTVLVRSIQFTVCATSMQSTHYAMGLACSRSPATWGPRFKLFRNIPGSRPPRWCLQQGWGLSRHTLWIYSKAGISGPSFDTQCRPPRYSARRHCAFLRLPISKSSGPGLVIAIGPNCSLCAHFGKKLEVNGVKASLANVL